MGPEWLQRSLGRLTSPREVHAAEEIRDEVQRRVNLRLAELNDDASISVPLPYRYAEPDKLGHNWAMGSYAGDRAYFKLVGVEVHNVQAIWNLP